MKKKEIETDWDFYGSYSQKCLPPGTGKSLSELDIHNPIWVELREKATFELKRARNNQAPRIRGRNFGFIFRE